MNTASAAGRVAAAWEAWRRLEVGPELGTGVLADPRALSPVRRRRRTPGYTSVGEVFAGCVRSAWSTPLTFPLLTALGSAVVAVFVPSSGGQWVVQGFVTAKAALAVGSTVPRGLLAVGIGDQMGNLMSPFWPVLTAGIARVDFRVFFGYLRDVLDPLVRAGRRYPHVRAIGIATGPRRQVEDLRLAVVGYDLVHMGEESRRAGPSGRRSPHR